LNSDAAKAAAPTPTATTVNTDNGAARAVQTADDAMLLAFKPSNFPEEVLRVTTKRAGRSDQHRISDGNSASGLEMYCVRTAHAREATGQVMVTGAVSKEEDVCIVGTRWWRDPFVKGDEGRFMCR
jgi:hypothetical protein